MKIANLSYLACAGLFAAGAIAQTETIPFSDLFPTDVPQEAVTLSVTFDVDASDGVANTTSPFPDDNNENDEPFGTLFLTTPNQAALSDLSESSDWVITSCDPTSLAAQQVVAFCSKAMTGSQCAHVFTGGATNTIVKMPAACGKGPLARVVQLAAHHNPEELPASATAGKPAGAQVFALHFDYEFAAIPASNGPVYMRADASDIPGYWDAIVDNPLSERRSAKFARRGWWSDFTGWIKRVTTVTQSNNNARTFSWSNGFPIFSVSKSCPGNPAYTASLQASVSGSAKFNTRYGFYFQGTLVPPAVSTAYVYFNGDASASASFTLSGTASVTYDATKVLLANFPFPGLSVPGIITIGPSLNLVGYISGSITLDGAITTGISYTFPPVNFALGPGSGMQSSAVSPLSSPANSITNSFAADVLVSANAALHLVPSVQLGISIVGGKLIDAQAYVQADLFAGINLNSSVSTTQALQFCINPFYGVNLSAGVRGNVLFWASAAKDFSFYQNQFNSASRCIMPTKREVLGLDAYEVDGFDYGLERRQSGSIPGTLSCPK